MSNSNSPVSMSMATNLSWSAGVKLGRTCSQQARPRGGQTPLCCNGVFPVAISFLGLGQRLLLYHPRAIPEGSKTEDLLPLQDNADNAQDEAGDQHNMQHEANQRHIVQARASATVSNWG